MDDDKSWVLDYESPQKKKSWSRRALVTFVIGIAGGPVVMGATTGLADLIHASSPILLGVIGSGFAGIALWWSLLTNRKLRIFDDAARGRYLMFIGVLLTLAWSSYFLFLSILILMGAFSI